MSCSCCNWWSQSKVIKRGSGLNSRECIATEKEITATSKECKYFNPTYFHCDEFGCRLKFAQCLSRRRNDKGFNQYEPCKKCRQFDKEIRPIVEKYFLDMVPIVTPRKLREQHESGNPGRKIRRRERKKSPLEKGLDVLLPKERTIKRREKPDEPAPRVIKRRGKASITSAIKSARKIRRRPRKE